MAEPKKKEYTPEELKALIKSTYEQYAAQKAYGAGDVVVPKDPPPNTPVVKGVGGRKESDIRSTLARKAAYGVLGLSPLAPFAWAGLNEIDKENPHETEAINKAIARGPSPGDVAINTLLPGVGHVVAGPIKGAFNRAFVDDTQVYTKEQLDALEKAKAAELVKTAGQLEGFATVPNTGGPAPAPPAGGGGGGYSGPAGGGAGGGGGGMGGGVGGPGAQSMADEVWGGDLTDPARQQELNVRAAARNVQARERDLANFYTDAARQQGAMADAVAHNEQIRAERAAKYHQAFNQASVELGKYANMNPTRAWDNLGAGGQIAAALAAGAAGWLNPGGPNMVLDSIDKMLDRDMQAQKLTFEQKKDVADTAKTAFAMAMERTGNEQAAEKLARASLLEDIKTRALGFQAKIESDKGKLAMEDLILKLEAQREKEVRDGLTHLLTSKTYMKAMGAGAGGGGGGSGGGGMGGGAPAPAGKGVEYLGRVEKDDVLNFDDTVGIIVHPKHQEKLTSFLDASRKLINSTSQMAAMAAQAKADPSLNLSADFRRKYQALVADNRQYKATMDGSGVMNPHETEGINQSLGAMSTLAFGAGSVGLWADPEKAAREAHERLKANLNSTLMRNSRGVVVRPPEAKYVKVQTGKGATAQHMSVENWQATNLESKDLLDRLGYGAGGGGHAGQPAQTDSRVRLVGK